MKQLLTIGMVSIILLSPWMIGCNPLGALKNNVDLCTVINCDAFGIVDIAGPRNILIPNRPDYSLDPTCTLPGFCGPSPYYPYSVAPGGL